MSHEWMRKYADLYGEKIRTQKRSSARVAQMTGLPLQHAKALARFVRLGEVPHPPLPDPDDIGDSKPEPKAKAEEEEKHDTAQYLLDAPYIYNEANDTYVTFLSDVPKPIVLPGSVHREIIRAYSNFDGAPASINEIARAVKLPRPWVVKYLRAHGITHDREPFTPEEIMSRSDDALIEDALQLRRATIYKKMEQAKWKEIRADAMKWRHVKDHILRAVSEAASKRPLPSVPRFEMEKADSPYAAVVGLTDFHWGKYSDEGENWEAYNREIARERLFEATSCAVRHMAGFGRPDRLIVPIGSDFLQIDNDLSQTTKGTPQDTDGTPAEILVSACQLMEEWINSLRQVAPVELVLMSGNHDRMTGLSILLYLEALFRQAPDVNARLDRTPRTYRVYGRNLIGFVHGDGVSKTRDMAGHMAREKAEAWARCPHRTVYTGHLHHEKTETDSIFSVTRRQIPSLSGPDRWHARHGYEGAPKLLPFYLHDKEEGIRAILYGRSEG